MKKILLATFLISISAATFARDNASRHEARKEKREMRKLKHLVSKDDFSYLTVQQFQRDFPDASSVAYKKGKNFDEVSFTTADGQQKVAYYDFYNTLVGTTESVAYSALPETARQEIARRYAGYHVGPVIYFQDNQENESDMILFSQSFTDADNYFVELNGPKNLIVKVSKDGLVSYFTDHL